MVFEKDFLDDLLEQAKRNPRLRQNYDLRDSVEDGSQRMLNALLPETVLPIHRHQTTSEIVVMIRGKMDEIFYDDRGNEIARYHLDANGDVRGMKIPVGQWHGLEVLEPTVIVEMKEGPFVPRSEDDILNVK